MISIIDVPKQSNILPLILDILEYKEPTPINLLQMQRIRVLLHDQGIVCENDEDILHCLVLLEKLGILKVEINPDNRTVLVGNIYNGK